MSEIEVDKDLKREFVNYVANSGIVDWNEFGRKFGKFMISKVDESLFDPTNDEQLMAMAENSVMSQLVITARLEEYAEVCKDNQFQLALFDLKKVENPSIADDFTIGMLEEYAEKWPRLKEL